jgi:hypothetical protein
MPLNRRQLALRIAGFGLIAADRAFAQTANAQKFPDVLAARITPRGPAFDFDVTISSPYDTPERYADAFRVLAPDGKLLGERILFHDHADEQPFTRDLHGVAIPAGIRSVMIEARDKQYGYGGKSITVALPGR